MRRLPILPPQRFSRRMGPANSSAGPVPAVARAAHTVHGAHEKALGSDAMGWLPT